MQWRRGPPVSGGNSNGSHVARRSADGSFRAGAHRHARLRPGSGRSAGRGRSRRGRCRSPPPARRSSSPAPAGPTAPSPTARCRSTSSAPTRSPIPARSRPTRSSTISSPRSTSRSPRSPTAPTRCARRPCAASARTRPWSWSTASAATSRRLLNINGTVGRGSAAVDLNTIPGLAIGRIEVLRDGASSQYGSDAIAGVINIQLKTANHGGRAPSPTANMSPPSTMSPTSPASRPTRRPALPRSRRQPGLRRQCQWRAQGPRRRHLYGRRQYRRPDGRRRLLSTSPANIATASATNRAGFDLRPNYNRPTARLRPARADLRPARIPLRRRQDRGHQPLRQRRDPARRRLGTLRLRLLRPSRRPQRRQLPQPERRRQPRFRRDRARDDAQRRQFRAADAGRLPSVHRHQAGRLCRDGRPSRRARRLEGRSVARLRPQQLRLYGEEQPQHVVRHRQPAHVRRRRAALRTDRRQSRFRPRISRSASPSRSRSRSAANIATRISRSVPASSNPTRPDRCSAPRSPRRRRIARPKAACSTPAPTSAASPAARRRRARRASRASPPASATDDSRHSWAAYVELDTDPFEGFTAHSGRPLRAFLRFRQHRERQARRPLRAGRGLALRGSISNGFRAPSLHQQFFTTTSTNFINGLPVDISTLAVDSPVARALGSRDLEPEKSLNLSFGATANPMRGPDPHGRLLSDQDRRPDRADRESRRGRAAAPPPSTPRSRRCSTPTASRASARRASSSTASTPEPAASTPSPPIASRPGELGNWSLTAAYNYNKTRIDARLNNLGPLATIPGIVLFGRVEGIRFTDGQPRDKIVFSADGDLGDFGLTARTTRYGKVIAPGATAPIADPLSLTAARPGRHLARRQVDHRPRAPLSARFKRRRARDRRRQRVRHLSGSLALRRAPGVDRRPYPINQYYLPYSGFSPFGFNGRFVYARASLDF